MRDSDARRLARNEDLFRRTNEAVAQGLWPGEQRGPMRVRCECSSLGCQSILEIELGQYEAVRSQPNRFVLTEGHDNPELERVVARRAGYVVVEKVGAGADEAEQLDPRG